MTEPLDLEARVTDMLDRRTREVRPSPDAFDRIEHKAGVRRRRQRVAWVGTSLVVVLLLVAGAVVITGSDGDDNSVDVVDQTVDLPYAELHGAVIDLSAELEKEMILGVANLASGGVLFEAQYTAQTEATDAAADALEAGLTGYEPADRTSVTAAQTLRTGLEGLDTVRLGTTARQFDGQVAVNQYLQTIDGVLDLEADLRSTAGSGSQFRALSRAGQVLEMGRHRAEADAWLAAVVTGDTGLFFSADGAPCAALSDVACVSHVAFLGASEAADGILVAWTGAVDPSPLVPAPGPVLANAEGQAEVLTDPAVPVLDVDVQAFMTEALAQVDGYADLAHSELLGFVEDPAEESAPLGDADRELLEATAALHGALRREAVLSAAGPGPDLDAQRDATDEALARFEAAADVFPGPSGIAVAARERAASIIGSRMGLDGGRVPPSSFVDAYLGMLGSVEQVVADLAASADTVDVTIGINSLFAFLRAEGQSTAQLATLTLVAASDSLAFDEAAVDACSGDPCGLYSQFVITGDAADALFADWVDDAPPEQKALFRNRMSMPEVRTAADLIASAYASGEAGEPLRFAGGLPQWVEAALAQLAAFEDVEAQVLADTVQPATGD